MDRTPATFDDSAPRHGLRSFLGARSRILLSFWWILLGLQTWFSWDLNEFYASNPLLLLAGELPFAVLGLAVALVVWIRGAPERMWRPNPTTITILVSAGMLWWSPVPWLGARIQLWRNQDRYMQQIEEARTGREPVVPRGSRSSPDTVLVEGQPPRFGVDRRAIGMFHWAAFVYDPDRTLEADTSEDPHVFQYLRLGYDPLWGNWYVVWAMK